MKKLSHIAYKSIKGKSPTVVFFSGFRSDMEGTKAVFLEGVCKKLGLGYVRFDYSGHGKSGGNFKDCTIGTWKADALKVIDELTKGDLILIGSSMGAWIMLLAALKRKERVKALIGIASAPDFTEDLIWQQLDEFSKHKMLRDGVLNMPNCYDDKEPYPITLQLIEEGRKHLLLRKKINLTCPIRLIHGMNDEDVPYETSTKIAKAVKSKDVQIQFIKNGDHRLSQKSDLEILKKTLLEILA